MPRAVDFSCVGSQTPTASAGPVRARFSPAGFYLPCELQRGEARLVVSTSNFRRILPAFPARSTGKGERGITGAPRVPWPPQFVGFSPRKAINSQCPQSHTVNTILIEVYHKQQINTNNENLKLWLRSEHNVYSGPHADRLKKYWSMFENNDVMTSSVTQLF